MIIGNRETISFELSDFTGGLLNINFYLGNRLISDEPIYVPTYCASLEQLLEQLNSGTLKNEHLYGLTPTELVTTLESERNSNESQFFRHLLQIVETIDQYSIYVLETNGTTSFNWYCWDEHNCNSEHQLKEIYSTELPTSDLISTLERLTSELKKELANSR
jgi:hypothetical protein